MLTISEIIIRLLRGDSISEKFISGRKFPVYRLVNEPLSSSRVSRKQFEELLSSGVIESDNCSRTDDSGNIINYYSLSFDLRYRDVEFRI